MLFVELPPAIQKSYHPGGVTKIVKITLRTNHEDKESYTIRFNNGIVHRWKWFSSANEMSGRGVWACDSPRGSEEIDT